MKLLNKPEVTDVVVHDVEPLVVPTDPSTYSRLGWLIVLLGVGGFLLWASFAPLDKGVPMSGTIAVSSNRKAIQHLSGGTVDEILVKDGDIVKAGQVLVRMNVTSAKSNYDGTRAQFIAAKASEARLIAERDSANAPIYAPVLSKAKNDPQVSAAIALQNQLFTARQSALHNELASFDENISGLKAQITGLKEATVNKKAQAELLKPQVDGMRDLAKDGYVPRNRLLDLERTAVQIDGAISDDRNNILKIERQISEMQFRRIQRVEEYQREVRTQLSDISRDADAYGARLDALEFELKNTDVRSPVDGIVMGLAVFTRGGVVSPGFHMMDVVPSVDALVVEGRLPTNLIDKVHTGLKVELIMAAFNTNKTPHIPGIVTQVSADSFTDEHNGQTYYKVTAAVTPEGAKLIAQHDLQLRPGMPAELFVHTGERTMMNYLLKPLFDRAGTSLTEE